MLESDKSTPNHVGLQRPPIKVRVNGLERTESIITIEAKQFIRGKHVGTETVTVFHGYEPLRSQKMMAIQDHARELGIECTFHIEVEFPCQDGEILATQYKISAPKTRYIYYARVNPMD